MEQKNYLGLYIGKNNATALCLSQHNELVGGFSVSIEQQEQADMQLLADSIAQNCAEKFTLSQECEVAIALDCSTFMQHDVHSEFSDPKQIASTIRFDTEEALATDITEVALAFQIISTDEKGSQLKVYTVKKNFFSQLITSLQRNNIDPVSVEPDICSLSRYISQDIPVGQPTPQKTFYAILSHRRGYFVISSSPESDQPPLTRTFLISPSQTRTEILTREIPMTMALVENDEPIDSIKIFDTTDSVNFSHLTERLAINTTKLDLANIASAKSADLSQYDNTVDFAIAYGAALAHSEKNPTINFRNDFLPYLGKKLRMQKTLKLLSVAVTVLLLVLGIYAQLKLFQKNDPRRRLHKKFEKEYSVVMSGKKFKSKTPPSKRLASELRRIKAIKSGQLSATGEKSIPAKLTILLEAFNKCASKTNLQIEKITITDKNINIVGDCSNRKNTLQLRKALEGTKLRILQDSLESSAGRDKFRITVATQK